jgi:RNA polymerase sigma factor (sigma-70 family)
MMMETNLRQKTDSNSRQRALRERARQLAAEFCAGNDHAFSELYDLYVQSLFNYGMKLTQDQELLKDCIHDVFVKVYTKRNEKHTINNLGSYLLISLKNRLLDEFRRNTFMDDGEVEHYDYRRASEDVEHDYLDTERELMQTAQVARLMNHLTRRQRQAITLYYLEERKYDEICDIMQMNYHSVRNLMHRGMLKLREAAM